MKHVKIYSLVFSRESKLKPHFFLSDNAKEPSKFEDFLVLLLKN